MNDTNDANVSGTPGGQAAPLATTPEALRQALVRNIDEVKLEHQQRAPRYDTRTGSVTSGTVATKLGAGYDILEPGMRACPYHYHLAQEEMFVILEGEGSLRVAGAMVPIRAGDVITIPPGPEYPHQIVNTGTVPMRYLSISTQERPEICYYPDSDKLGAFAKDHNFVGRRATSIDYWEGEP